MTLSGSCSMFYSLAYLDVHPSILSGNHLVTLDVANIQVAPDVANRLGDPEVNNCGIHGVYIP